MEVNLNILIDYWCTLVACFQMKVKVTCICSSFGMGTTRHAMPHTGLQGTFQGTL